MSIISRIGCIPNLRNVNRECCDGRLKNYEPVTGPRHPRPRVGGARDGAIPHPATGHGPRGEEVRPAGRGLVHPAGRQP